MTIKQHGGIFGRNPKFNNVEVESLSIAGNAVPDASTILVDGDIGSTVQGYDADTAKYDDVTANFTGTLQNGGSDVVVDTDIGSTVQGYDAGLASIAGLTTASDKMIYTTASDTYAVADITSAGRAILDDADAAAQRTTLGLGTIATQDADNVNIDGGAIDGTTLGSNAVITEAHIDDVDIDGSTISNDAGVIGINSIDSTYHVQVDFVAHRRISFTVPTSTTQTVTLSGLNYAAAEFHLGGYAAAGQGYIHKALVLGGAMVSTARYNVTDLASVASGNAAIGATTKNANDVTFTIQNTSTTQPLQCYGWIVSYGVGLLTYSVA